jgi:hypothetical protein
MAVQQAAAALAVEEDAALVVDARADVAAAGIVGVFTEDVVEPLRRRPADDRLEFRGARQQGVPHRQLDRGPVLTAFVVTEGAFHAGVEERVGEQPHVDAIDRHDADHGAVDARESAVHG